MGVQAGVDLLTSSARDVMTYGRGLQEIGAGNVRGMASTDGRVEGFYQAQAEALFDFTRTQGARTAGLTMDEISGQIVDFAGAGGFRGMTPSQFSETLFQLPSAVRQLSQGANLDQSTAASMIGSMVNIGLADNVLNASTQALTTANLGGQIGMSPNQIFGAGMAAITATGGMGIAPGDAFNLGTQATALTAQAVLQRQPDAISLSNRLGGSQQAGFAMIEMGLREMMSPLGLARAANVMAGGSENAGITQSLIGAGAFFSQDPGNMLSAIANQGAVVGGMNPLTIQNAPVQNAVDLMQGMGLTNGQGQVNSDQLIGMMMQLDPSLSRDQAGLAVYNAAQGSGPTITQALLSARESLVDVNRMNAVSPIGAAWSAVSQPFVNNWDRTFGAMGRGLMGTINNLTESVGDTINEVLTGITIERRDPVRDQSVTSIVEDLVAGTGNPILDQIVGQVGPVDRHAMTQKAASAQSNRYFKSAGEPDFIDSANGMAIFDRLTYGKSDSDRAKLTEYLNREQRMGRLDNLDIDDVMAFDESMSEYSIASGRLDNDGRQKVQSIEKLINTRFGTDNATIEATRNKIQGMSDNDALNMMAGWTGFDSYAEANDVAKVAIMRKFIATRELEEGGFIYMNRGFNDLTPSLTESQAIEKSKELIGRESLNAAMPQVRSAQDKISSAVTTALTTTGGELSQEFYDRVKAEFGIDGNFGASDLADIIAGKRTDLPGALEVISKLEKTGSAQDSEFAMQLNRVLNLGNKAGLSNTVDVGGSKISVQQAIDLDNAFQIKDDIVDDVNSFASTLPPELVGDERIMETIERIATNERLAGKDKETVKTALDSRIGRILEFNRKRSIEGISNKLKDTVAAEALLGADALAESIDFQSRFDNLDAEFQNTAAEAIRREFFITGARVNKKLEDAISGSGEQTFLKTGGVPQNTNKGNQ